MLASKAAGLAVSSPLRQPLAIVRHSRHVCNATSSVSGRSIVVAVDGPAASGKGTLAKKIAAAYNLAHMDTGLLYRGVGFKAVRTGVRLDDEAALEALSLGLTQADLADTALRTDEAATAASKVSVLPRVRQALLDYQRNFARQPAAGYQGAVLDGRDIGTAVCPDAQVKLFVVASAEARAERRYKELVGKGLAPSYQQVLQDLLERDKRDSSRATAPMRAAPDAHLLDTSNLNQQEAMDAACKIIEEACPQLQRAVAVSS